MRQLLLMFLKKISMIPYVLILSACTDNQITFYSDVEALSDKNITPPARYVLVDSTVENPLEKNESLEFKKYNQYVHAALYDLGWQQVSLREFKEKPESDIVVIGMTYGVTKDKETYSYSVPTYGITGYSSQSSLSSYNIGGFNTGSITTTTTPQYGITGSESRTGVRTIFHRYLGLRAYEFVSDKKSSFTEKWKVQVISSGRSDDLGEVMPFMAIATKPNIGKNHPTKTTVRVDVFSRETAKFVESAYFYKDFDCKQLRDFMDKIPAEKIKAQTVLQDKKNQNSMLIAISMPFLFLVPFYIGTETTEPYEYDIWRLEYGEQTLNKIIAKNCND